MFAMCLLITACDGSDTSDNDVSSTDSATHDKVATNDMQNGKASRKIDKNNLAVLALTASDGRVVVKTPVSDMTLLKKGDTLPGYSATLIDVLPDRAVFEETAVYGNEKLNETVWVYQAVNGVSRVQRLSKRAPSAPAYHVPVLNRLETDSGDESIDQ